MSKGTYAWHVTASERHGIKISAATYKELKRLTSEAARNGWSAFGMDRDDPPTQQALLEVAIQLLSEHQKKAKGRRKR